MRRRSVAEWTTFGVAVAIIVALVAVILGQAPNGDDPALPAAVITGPAERHGDSYVVPVEVENRGGSTAETVQVIAELKIGAETFDAEQQIDSLAGGEAQEIAFLFEKDPAKGELSVRVRSFSVP